jgi:hypothetical protein
VGKVPISSGNKPSIAPEAAAIVVMNFESTTRIVPSAISSTDGSEKLVILSAVNEIS